MSQSSFLSLQSLAQGLDIDTDFVVRKSPNTTQLLLRLGDGQNYAEENHNGATETILVLSGHCDLAISNQTFHLETGDQITVPAKTIHQFLATSECCLSVVFEAEE